MYKRKTKTIYQLMQGAKKYEVMLTYDSWEECEAKCKALKEKEAAFNEGKKLSEMVFNSYWTRKKRVKL